MEAKEKKQIDKKIIIPIIGIIIAIIVVGISFAIWNYAFTGSANTISTAEASLDLLESNTNIINITNALPMSDNEGKAQTDTFDFAVTSKTTKDIKIKYTINIQKLEVDTGYTSLNDNQIKVYLTDYSDNQIVPPTLISNLTNYKLYTGTHSHDATHQTVQDKFKLRAWIDGAVDASNWNAETKLQYKFKIGISSEEDNTYFIYTMARNNSYDNRTISIGQPLEPGTGTLTKYCIVYNDENDPWNSCTDSNQSYETLGSCEEEIASWEENEGLVCEPVEEPVEYEGVGEYTTNYQEFISNTYYKGYFLRHTVGPDNKIKLSEACAIINNNLYCFEPGMEKQQENVNRVKQILGENSCNENNLCRNSSITNLQIWFINGGNVSIQIPGAMCGGAAAKTDGTSQSTC